MLFSLTFNNNGNIIDVRKFTYALSDGYLFAEVIGLKNIVRDNGRDMAFLKAFMLISPFIFGGFHVWVSAVYSVCLCGYIAYRSMKSGKKIHINVGVTLLALLLVSVSYLVVSLWAVDSGTAIYGFVKILPVALFGLIASECSSSERTEILGVVPYGAATMGVVSYALSFIPWFSKYFLVAERLGGFFQYPNSFAVYCLAGLAVLLTKEKIQLKHWCLSALLIGIILLTGSRTVFVFLVLTVLILFFKLQSANKIRLLCLVGGAVALSLFIVIITDNVQTVGRLLTISLESSTLQGRLLYYKDALPVILKNPFGLGYYGYYYSQGAFQTGVYSVAYIHNEFLQLLLDIGWIPSFVLFLVFGVSLLSKATTFTQKIVLFIILGHSFFDFDLQFISVFFVLILVLDFESCRKYKLSLPKTAVFVFAGIFTVISLYFGLINSLFLLNKYSAVEKLYGKDTQSQVYLITESDNYNEIIRYADSVLSRNKYIAIVYDAKANDSYKQGDIQSVIEYKWRAIECAPYSIEEYNDFCAKLIPVIDAYRNMGDNVSADFCEDTLIEIKDRLTEVKNKTSSFAWKIKDKPELELSEEYNEYIARLE